MADTVAMTEAPGAVHEAPEEAAFGLTPPAWVALSMIAVIAIMVWKKVPSIIGAALDRKIAAIRTNLDEAAKLRAEAEALKAEYEAKAKAASAEADAMIATARTEANAIVEQAHSDATALVARRGKLAEEKIAAAERAAIAEVRTKAATAAAAAAATIIRETHDAAADKALVDQAITALGNARLN